jgi:cytoskeleton protein RodZ
MSSVGETLRRERLRAGLDLEKISQDTKISVRMLEQIEANQFEKLPGGVFARSFVRQYARAVGLDEEEIAAELGRTVEPAAKPAPVVEETSRPELDLPPVAVWGGESRLRQSSSLPALALLVLMVVGCSIAYTWWQKSRHSSSPPAQAQVEESVPATAVPPEAPPAQTAPEAANPPSQPGAAPVASPVSNATIETAAGTLTVGLTAAEATWVQAKANGKVVFSGIIQPNETKSLQAADTVTLRIGNAGGISISLNGKAIPAVGPKGQVRVVQLRPDGGVQVDPPKPPTPPGPAQQTL